MTLALAEETAAVQKICPLPSELSFITKNIPCPEEGCNGTFLNSSNLEMHLSKHHKKRSDRNNKREYLHKTNCQYHCPVEKCLYNINSDRHFTHIKYLKQHYLKVHAEKKFLCKKCDKGFSTEAACNVHMRICGMKFTCSCGCNYMSYEALITHAKRKNHAFDANLKLCAKGQVTGHRVQPCSVAPPEGQPPPFILALGSLPINVQPLGAILPAPSAVDVAIQTDRPYGGRRSAASRRSSAQTQTWSVRRSKICAGTQTQGDYILKRAMRAAQLIPVEGEVRPAATGRKRKKSMETQTTQGEVRSQHRRAPSFAPPAPADGEGAGWSRADYPWMPPDDAKCHSGTQTNPPAPRQPVVTQTEDPFRGGSQYLCQDDSPPCSPRFDPMLLAGESCRRPAETQTESSDPTLSHIETQTNTEDFLSFEQLLHANMCTQTCDDTSLFSDLGFSDIQTQTQDEATMRSSFWREDDPSAPMVPWCPMLVSTETQTAGQSPWMSETSHMETQTDVDELRRLIAELTKHDIEGE